MLKYKNFQLISPSQVQKERLDFLVESQNGSIFHETKLNEIVERHFGGELKYFVNDHSQIDVFSPVHIKRSKYGRNKYYFKPNIDIPYAGFVGNQDVNLEKLSVNFFESISYEGFPNKKVTKSDDSIHDQGLSAMLNLNSSEDDIFGNIISSKTRNMIRKAVKLDIRVEIFKNEEGLKLFWPMLNDLHKKLQLNFLSYDYYKDVFNCYSKTNQAFILIAFKNEVAISGVFVLGNKNFMHYYKGASKVGLKNEGQGELLQWEAIKQSKKLGSNFYDLCNLEKNKLPFIYRFKTGICKELYSYQVINKSNTGYKIINRILKDGKSL